MFTCENILLKSSLLVLPKIAVTNHEQQRETHLYHAPGHHLRENVDGFGE